MIDFLTDKKWSAIVRFQYVLGVFRCCLRNISSWQLRLYLLRKFTAVSGCGNNAFADGCGRNETLQDGYIYSANWTLLRKIELNYGVRGCYCV